MVNLETSQKFERKEEKNQNQISNLVKPIKISRFHNTFKDLTKWIPNFPIFVSKFISIFHQNKNLNQKLTMDSYLNAQRRSSMGI